MFNGISSQTGPGLPDVAKLHAFSKWYRISEASLICTAYLVIFFTDSTILNS
jgi:hypothetical protein